MNLIKISIRRKAGVQVELEKLHKASTHLYSKIFNFSIEEFCNNSGFHSSYSNLVTLIGQFWQLHDFSALPKTCLSEITNILEQNKSMAKLVKIQTCLEVILCVYGKGVTDCSSWFAIPPIFFLLSCTRCLSHEPHCPVCILMCSHPGPRVSHSFPFPC